MRRMSRTVRRTFTKLTVVRRGALVLLTAALALRPAGSGAAAAQRDAPRAAQHTEYVVEVNRKGQVTRIRSGKSSRDLAFNTMTYGNALQAFIRTADGRSIPGTYRLAYDYAPKTRNVRRSVALLHAGGVNADALGAVDRMTADARSRLPETHASAKPLPDFESIERSH